jgi:hypothetical protein
MQIKFTNESKLRIQPIFDLKMKSESIQFDNFLRLQTAKARELIHGKYQSEIESKHKSENALKSRLSFFQTLLSRRE